MSSFGIFEVNALRVAIYIRKSRKDRASTEPRLKMQRTELPEHARKMGATTLTIYDDGHCSASKNNISNLSERNRMISDVKAGLIDVILVIEISRLSRDDSMTDMMELLELCRNNKVRLATPSRILNPADTNDWAVLTIEGCMSAAEMKRTLERMKQGASFAFMEGRYLGGQVPKPYVQDKASGKLITDQSALKECQRLWRLAETHSAQAIATKLGMPVSTVRRALSDTRLDYLQAIRRDPETNEIIRCEWEAVISADQAARIKAARKTRETNGNNTKPNSLLSGLNLLKCGYCRKTVKTWSNGKLRKNGTRLKYYGCSKKSIKNACKKSRTLPQNILDECVLTNVFNSLVCLEDLMRYWLASHSNDDLAAQEKKLKAEERKLQQEMELLVEAYTKKLFTFEETAKRKANLKTALTEIEQERQSIQSPQIVPPDWDSLLLTREEFDSLDYIDRRRFLTLILDEVRLYEKYAIITYTFPRDDKGNRKARIHLPEPRRGTSWGRNPRYKGA